MTLGNDDSGYVDIKRSRHSDGAGGPLRIFGGSAVSGQTDQNGGGLHFIGGIPTGDGTFGDFTFWAGVQGASGTSLRTQSRIATLSSNGSTSTDFYMYEKAGSSTSDYFKISVLAHGATTLSTVDASATNAGFKVDADGDITLDSAGVINLDSDSSDTGQVNFKHTNTRYADFSFHHAASWLMMYENGGASEDDYFAIQVDTHGATTLRTVDNAAAAAHFEIEADGDITLDAAGSTTVESDLTVSGVITGKQYQVFPSNFIDDLNTGQVFIPLHGTTFEQSTVYQDDVAIVAPCDGRVVSVALSALSLTGTGNLTIKVYTIGPNNSGTSLGSWTEEESESLAFTSSDDSHVFHFAFSNAKHFESTEKIALSIQSDSDPGSNTYWYTTTVIEWDYSTLLGGTSAEYDAAP